MRIENLKDLERRDKNGLKGIVLTCMLCTFPIWAPIFVSNVMIGGITATSLFLGDDKQKFEKEIKELRDSKKSYLWDFVFETSKPARHIVYSIDALISKEY